MISASCSVWQLLWQAFPEVLITSFLSFFSADALQAGASQFETNAGKLKRKYWWKNCKMMIILAVIILIILIIIIGRYSNLDQNYFIELPGHMILSYLQKLDDKLWLKLAACVQWKFENESWVNYGFCEWWVNAVGCSHFWIPTFQISCRFHADEANGKQHKYKFTALFLNLSPVCCCTLFLT